MRLEGDVQDIPIKSSNIPSLLTGKRVQDLFVEFEGNLSER